VRYEKAHGERQGRPHDDASHRGQVIHASNVSAGGVRTQRDAERRPPVALGV
jgi:hypothetical protein